MLEPFEYDFFRHALIAGLLASVACGIVGSFVVVKRITSIAGGLSHAAFGGLGLGYLLSFNPMIGAVVFTVASALIIGVVYRRQQQAGLETLVSMVWAVGMALGVLFLSMAPGSVPDLNSYLFGSILFVPSEYLLFVGILDAVLVFGVAFFFREFQAISFDEEFSEISGLPVDRFFLSFLALTAVVIVTLIRVVGVIMLIALLAMPAMIARQWTHTLRGMICCGTGVCWLATMVGLFLSWWFAAAFGANTPTGPLVILTLAGLFVGSSIIQILREVGKLRKSQSQ